MKSSFRSLLLFLVAMSALCLPVLAEIEIWVSPEGSAGGDGSAQSPFDSILLAQRQARELRRLEDPAIADGIRILLRGGTYRLDEPLLVRWEDSGTADSPTTIAAAPGEEPVISGGVPVADWKRAPAETPGLGREAAGEVWVAEAPRAGGRPVFFRDLWVNDRRVQRAWNSDGQEFDRIVAWDKGAREAWIPAAAVEGLGDPAGLEMVIHQMWAIAIVRVQSIKVVGDRAKLTFHEPESRVQFEHPWPPVVISEDHGNSIYYLANRLEFVDEPGEWYQDPYDGRIYYWPREDEDPAAMTAVAPTLETLVRFEGTPDRPVEHVGFEGVRFRHTRWMRPSEAGHVPLQAGFYMYDAYKLRQPGTPDKAKLENQAWVGRKPAAVELRHVRGTRFEGCHFEQLAASGLDYVIGAKNDVIEGNVFRDIGGSGFVLGPFQEEGVETHVPYFPSDERLICEGTRFANNLVTDIANQDWGCVGVLVGYARDVLIAHNELSALSYTGISIGWGWTPTEMPSLRDITVRANHIHDYGQRVYDTAGIYTLSNQPGTVIEENAIHSIARPSYVHDPYHWSYIYLDEGSSNITVRNNWTERIKFSTNSTGPGNVFQNTGPDATEVRAAAGLEDAHRHLLRFAAGPEK